VYANRQKAASAGYPMRFGNVLETELCYHVPRRKWIRMAEERRPYISYLLRLQCVRRWDRWVWCASLESPGSGSQLRFRDLPSLFAFLEAQTHRDTPVVDPDMETE
jgi:hypothetical protein